ncbi:hypothetical protein J2X98_002820 [Pseudarthrobacter enclensis]|uniref:Uncharacterized protein n=1 Tax=Pseudarthrobacter enclensis TaxID=993070 RepID=A0ABT9RVF7_9MICC|nr:hypothetical protein [Pseudarthrobacter enclensis]
MSVLVTFLEVSPPDPRLGAPVPGLTPSSLDGTTAPQGEPAVHCGTRMQLVTPAIGWEGASYTFASMGADGTTLPPVWRCSCGFQLDAGIAGSRQDHASMALTA